MAFELSSATHILQRTPAILDAWLRDLPDEWIHADEGPDTFSTFEIVGHLIHGERTDWMPRLARLLEHGESLPFDPFDRFAQREASDAKTLSELLDTFAALRHANLTELARLDLNAADLARTGRHPDLGTVTAGELLATWTAHDLAHLRQIARVMAKRYRDDVGPWRAYMNVFG